MKRYSRPYRADAARLPGVQPWRIWHLAEGEDRSVESGLVVVCEDIGRHNAVDKAVGYCLLRGIALGNKILVSTGRASYDMVAKGVRMGVPIIASISSPTSLAAELAEALNCTLLGYLRGRKLNVYTHGWRIVSNGQSPADRGTGGLDSALDAITKKDAKGSTKG